MDDPDPASLFSSIDSFLRSCPAGIDDGRAQGYWQDHPCISVMEIEMLTTVGCRALCVEALAQVLQRDVGCTRRLLEALVAIGILERAGDLYAATPAAKLYCWALSEGRLPEGE